MNHKIGFDRPGLLATHFLIEVPKLAADHLGLGLTGRTCFPGRWIFAGNHMLQALTLV